MPRSKKSILIIGANADEFALWQKYLQPQDNTEIWQPYEAAHLDSSERDYLTYQPDCILLTNSLPAVEIGAILTQLQYVAGANLVPILLIIRAEQEREAQEALYNGAVTYLFKEELTERVLCSAVHAALRQEELRRERNSFRDSVENAPVGVHWVSPDGVILWANQAELNLMGYTREEYIGRKIAEFHTDQEVAARMIEKLAQHETLNDFTAQLRCKDGSCRDVLVSSNVRWEKGVFLHTRCFTKDVTERKKIEAARQQAEDALAWQARIIELSYEPILVWEITGNIVEWNAGARQLYGFTKQEALGRSSVDLLQTNYPLTFDELIKTLKDKGEWMGELYHKTKDGRELLVESRHQLITLKGRQFVLETNRDITERLEAKVQLEQAYLEQMAARVEAEDANRAKDEFLAVVSHELRAPLNSMLGWAKILKGGKYTTATLEHAIDIIERSARLQQKMIEDLLDSARIISGKLRLEIQPVEMTNVIEATLETIRPAVEAKGLQLEVSYLPGTDIITGDAERLQQVVWNLVSNAVKFTPQGGRIEVRLKRVDPHLQLTISDTGRGINPEFMPYIFNRFQQADSSITRRQSGLGLGLSLVRHLVELHGGTIQVESAGEGQGATFTLALPFRAVRTVAQDAVSTGAFRQVKLNQLAALTGLCILVVDDEADARELVKVILEQSGAQVLTAASVAEALNVLTNPQNIRPDAIVSDIGMPEENGYALIRQIRTLTAAQGGQLPAIALTAFGRASDRIAALSAGFQMHVSKPVEAAELVMVIASLTGRAELDRNA